MWSHPCAAPIKIDQTAFRLKHVLRSLAPYLQKRCRNRGPWLARRWMNRRIAVTAWLRRPPQGTKIGFLHRERLAGTRHQRAKEGCAVRQLQHVFDKHFLLRQREILAP